MKKEGSAMSVYISAASRVITQGITGRTGRLYTERCLHYAAGRECFVAGVHPAKAGQEIFGLPIYASVREAAAATGATVSVIYVPPAAAAAAIMEAVEADVELVICLTHGVPVRDMLEVRSRMRAREAAGARATLLLGPDSPGIISPGALNIGVLPESSITARVDCLRSLLSGQLDWEMMALNSRESFEANKNFYRQRQEKEELPAIRRLLALDSQHLDDIQVRLASGREFYLLLRLRGKQESDIRPYLSRVEQHIKNSGFTTRRANAREIKQMLSVYFEQNITAEGYEDYDGQRWEEVKGFGKKKEKAPHGKTGAAQRFP